MYITHALKRNLTHDTAWMHLDDTMLSETRQSRRLVTMSDQIHREKSRMGAGAGEELFSGVWEMEMAAHPCECIEGHGTAL